MEAVKRLLGDWRGGGNERAGAGERMAGWEVEKGRAGAGERKAGGGLGNRQILHSRAGWLA